MGEERNRYQSPYYRVSVKALILDNKQRLLVFKDKYGEWEIPGGGWEHDESYKACLRRELKEEMNASVASIGLLQFFYRNATSTRGVKLNLVFKASLASNRFTPGADDLVEARYVTKAQFLQLPFQLSERDILDFVDEIWQPEPV
jgi:8-oxo-dGTP diphosphatase